MQRELCIDIASHAQCPTGTLSWLNIHYSKIYSYYIMPGTHLHCSEIKVWLKSTIPGEMCFFPSLSRTAHYPCSCFDISLCSLFFLYLFSIGTYQELPHHAEIKCMLSISRAHIITWNAGNYKMTGLLYIWVHLWSWWCFCWQFVTIGIVQL